MNIIINLSKHNIVNIDFEEQVDNRQYMRIEKALNVIALKDAVQIVLDHSEAQRRIGEDAYQFQQLECNSQSSF